MFNANEFEVVNAMVGKSYINAKLEYPAAVSVVERFENLKTAKLNVKRLTIAKIEIKRDSYNKDKYYAEVTFDNGETRTFWFVKSFNETVSGLTFLNKRGVVMSHFDRFLNPKNLNTSKGTFKSWLFMNNNGETDAEIREMLENKAKEVFAEEIENKKKQMAELLKEIEYYEKFCK